MSLAQDSTLITSHQQLLSWLFGLPEPKRCIVWIQTAAVSNPRNRTYCTLNREAVDFCQRHWPAYNQLRRALADCFGQPFYCLGNHPGPSQTGSELLRPPAYAARPELTCPDGLADEMPTDPIERNQWIRQLQRKISAETATDWDNLLAKSSDIFRLTVHPSTPETNLLIGVGEEPVASLLLLARDWIKPELAGLTDCQAFLVIRDQTDQAVAAAKFVPTL